MNHRPEQFPVPEARENEPRFWRAESTSFASADHPDRNDDAVLGDAGRLGRAQVVNPRRRAEVEPADIEAMELAAARERELAAKLEELGIFGGGDGLSLGNGEVAGRLAMASIAVELSSLPPDADADASSSALDRALRAAAATLEEQGRKTGLRYSTTAAVFRVIPQEDGSALAVFASVGDSRLYLLPGDDGKMRQLTEDDETIAEALRDGAMTEEEAWRVKSASSPGNLPENLKKYWSDTSDVTACLDSESDFDAHLGRVRLRNGDSIVFTTDGVHESMSNDSLTVALRNGGAQTAVDYANYRIRKRLAGTDDLTCLKVTYAGRSPAQVPNDERKAEAPETDGAEIESLSRAVTEAEAADAETRKLLEIALRIDRSDPEDRGRVNVMGGLAAITKGASEARHLLLEARRRLLRARRAADDGSRLGEFEREENAIAFELDQLDREEQDEAVKKINGI